ncbi:hypothetical protein [Streptomyces sp. SP18CS02]|uniref:hypothetical protein n=1 Tax=Streptomyces sp. SP18CS02 TaxID=3002531 RepID=UPI002E7A792D|nr:hypothetical protein [Streptomyces sp. SP18CS02]MEE1753951.1 hypothetical protein [Streptomyces sp. SP18CS02]
MPIDPFAALNAMLRAEAARAREPEAGAAARQPAPRDPADAPATDRPADPVRR